MGYYECPRCGSKDSYQGTEHVLHEKRGNQITMVNEAGMAMTRETGDGTEQVELMVVKCRNCGESLGQKDYRLTEAEIAAEEAQNARERRKQQKKIFRWHEIQMKWVVVPGIVICGIFLLIEFLKSIF